VSGERKARGDHLENVKIHPKKKNWEILETSLVEGFR